MMKSVLIAMLMSCTAVPAFADAWVGPTQLSRQGGRLSSAAVDANGNVVVVWEQTVHCTASSFGCQSILARSRAPGKSWGSVQTVPLCRVRIVLPCT